MERLFASLVEPDLSRHGTNGKVPVVVDTSGTVGAVGGRENARSLPQLQGQRRF